MPIVRSREDVLDRLKKAQEAYADIMLSSMYSHHHDPVVMDVIDFDEFVEVYDKLGEWYIGFRDAVNENTT